MALDISLATVGVSALVSVITSYFGTIINFNRLRNRRRRELGLSFLVEIKALQRRLRRHRQRLEAVVDAVVQVPPKLAFSDGDTSVFNNGSGSLGLFTTSTAVKVLEYYSAVRAMAAEANSLSDEAVAADARSLRAAIDEHLRAILLTRHHSRVVVVALRRDIPMTSAETLRFGARLIGIVARRAHRAGSRWTNSVTTRLAKPVTLAGPAGHMPGWVTRNDGEEAN